MCTAASALVAGLLLPPGCSWNDAKVARCCRQDLSGALSTFCPWVLGGVRVGWECWYGRAILWPVDTKSSMELVSSLQVFLV